MNNQAFIDGQNLHLSTTSTKSPWKVDLFRFYKYLEQKYKVEKAYYFIGCYEKKQEKLYRDIRDAGFELIFREHDAKLRSAKKGNVDTDIVFAVMSKLYRGELEDRKVLLISGDGDYFKMVKFLISEKRFHKILLPTKKNYSTLYSKIPQKYRAFLDDKDVKRKIEYKK